MIRNLGWSVLLSLAALTLTGWAAAAEEPPARGPAEFYANSLHFTNRGIEYVYAKEQGGLERIVGLSASELGCIKAKCHVTSCDDCHRKEVDGKAVYTADRGRILEACARCHPVEKDDPDVHFRKGMTCLDCHTAREIHGDGTAVNTYQQPGVLEVRCRKCHANISRSVSHTIHDDKLDCSACHTREVVTCFNCHVDARRAAGKDVEIPLKGMLFLVNHDGKVTTANLLSYVSQKKTMITVAAYFSHSIRKEGRTCVECHGSGLVRSVADGSLQLARFEGGTLKGAEGVIPLVEGMRWDLPFLDYVDGSWTPLAPAGEPLVNFAPFTTPLSREQLAKLEKPKGTGR